MRVLKYPEGIVTEKQKRSLLTMLEEHCPEQVLCHFQVILIILACQQIL